MERRIKQKELLPVHQEVANLNVESKPNGKMTETWFVDVFQLTLDSIIVFNHEGKIVDVNPAFCSIMNEDPYSMIGRTLYDLVPYDKHYELNHQLMLLEQVGKAREFLAFLTPNGPVNFEVVTTKQPGTLLNISIMRDVSERDQMEKKLKECEQKFRRIQEQLWKSDRLNVIGQLAAGIAHEIRNPMTALKGFIQLLESNIKAEHDMYYQVITSELARIDSIINEFLILAKPQSIQFQEADVNQIIRETVDLLHAQAALYNVQCNILYENPMPLIYCEPNQLKKVFINIIKNAIEVMPDGGNVDISTKMINEYQLMISIKDEGTGIPEERIKMLGEPFYTTKERGTGLGLMVSYKIIEEHHGLIQIESEEGKGSTFHITLPFFKGSVKGK